METCKLSAIVRGCERLELLSGSKRALFLQIFLCVYLAAVFSADYSEISGKIELGIRDIVSALKIRAFSCFDLGEQGKQPALETLFFQHLKCLGEFYEWEQQLYFWRSAEKLEVDFVSYGPLGLFAFEIKRSSVLREEDLRSLMAFKKDYPVANAFLIYGGEKTLRRENIDIIPYLEALKKLPEIFGVKV